MTAHNKHSKRPVIIWTAATLFVLSLVLGLVWRFTSLHDRFSFDVLTQWGQMLQGKLWAPLAIIGIYAIGELILFPHAVLLWTTVFVFDPWHAFLYCELGTFASGITVYSFGRIVRPELVKRIAGTYLDKVSQALATRGKSTLVILHWFPICPFSILNFLAGATHISLDDFLIGTAIGCTPGILLIAFFGHQILHAVHSHRGMDWLPVAVGAIVVFTGFRWLRYRLGHTERLVKPT